MKKKLLVICSIVILIPLAIWAWDIYKDRQVSIEVESESALYATETEAFKQSQPTKMLKPAEMVKVIQTTYGKDYWALYVETAAGSKGWVVSGQPGLKILSKR